MARTQDRKATSPLSIERSLDRIEGLLESQADRLEALSSRLDSVAGLSVGMRLRREATIPVHEPLALICQAQRSGGTLMIRLFDGHPECHAHPHELHIGDRRPHIWPDLPLDEAPEAWFAKLEEEKLRLLFAKGRRKVPLKAGHADSETYFPFLLPPAFQRQIFLDEVKRTKPTTERQILDCYMTSLFNGWLDNQNLRTAHKRWVVAFSPRRAWGKGLDQYFEIYPEGRLISVIRDPLSWYTSAQGRDPDAAIEPLLELWKRSATEMLEAKRRFGDQVCIVRFDELLLDTPATMRTLAEFLGIEYLELLATPTFNGYPVGANSSYSMSQTGVGTDPVDRYKELLDEAQQERIRGECEGLYEEVLASVGDKQAEIA